MHSLLVLYGSETGTAEDVAEGLWKEARLLDVPARLFGMDEYDIENLPNERAVAFVVATTGQGEIPPNMRSAWLRMLRKSLPRDWLRHINFGVLGLGDSSYQKYNFASKKLFRRLLQLGGNSLLDIGLDRPTLRTCFLRIFDLQVIPRKSFFQTLASISTDPDEKEKLLEFASPQGIRPSGAQIGLPTLTAFVRHGERLFVPYNMTVDCGSS
ncbi:flavodoxin [Teladorsagia circumcincta]|uniref:Flavodoxin n=1 Tax=Teladorsagia circumcincta TaxID=45464 RepID=A0A2G9V1E2_TELCI|nr:flavodoxin [Teladorsagia circumcincta]